VFPPPIVGFTGSPLSGCPPVTTSFTDNTNTVVAGAATYNWSFGDGTSSTLQNPTHIFTNPGQYIITLNVTNSKGCNASLIKTSYVNVAAPPIPDFSFQDICKTPGSTTFVTNVSGSSPFTYSWDFGDGTYGTGNNPVHTYTSSGSYTVKLIVTDANGCVDSISKPIGVATLHAGFNSADTACIGMQSFINASVGAATYSWDFGDNTPSSMLTNPIHTFSVAGTYNVRLIATNAAQTCKDTFIKQVVILPGPNVDFTITPVIPCSAADTLFFTNNTTGAVSYQWFFGDATPISTQTSPYHIYTFDSIYTITLVATDSFGCTNSKMKMDTVYNMQAVASLVYTNGEYNHCVPATINFTDTLTFRYYTLATPAGWRNVTIPITAASILWDFGDGTTSTNHNPTHTYTSSGNFVATLTILTSNGCTLIDTIAIKTGTLPTASFTVADDTLCNNGYQTFIGNVTNVTDLYWYIYQGGNDWQADAVTHPPAYNLATQMTNALGFYSTTLVASDNGCNDTFTLTNAFSVQPPKASAFIQPDCDTLTLVRFNDMSVGPVTSRTWFFGDGTSDTSKSPTHIYPSLGNYTVKLVVHNATTGCSDSIINNIVLYSPSATFFASDSAICMGDTITFAASSLYPLATVGFIPEGALLTSSGWVYPNPGIFKVTMQYVTMNGCLDSTTKTNYILVADPNPNFFSLPPVGCDPFTANFTDNGSNTPGAFTTQWYWDFGDNSTQTTTTASVSHTYAPGIYNVSLIVVDNVGCSDTLERPQYIEAHKTTALFFADDTTACLGQVISFTNKSASATNHTITYQWNFGDGSPIDTSKNPTHTYNQTGAFTVSLIVTDNVGCADTLTFPNYIKLAQPTAGFTLNDSLALCPPLNVQFTNTSTGASQYSWSFGDGSSSIIPSPVNIYINPGLYTVRLIAINSYGCKDTTYDSVRVLGYSGGLTYQPLAGCNPLSVNFTASLVGVTNFLWDFGDGTIQTANGFTTTYTYTTPGKFLPKMVFTDSVSCVNSSSGLDTIYIDDVLGDYYFSPACINTPIVLTDTSYSYFSPMQSYAWNVNNGQVTGTQKQLTVSFAAPGNYPVTLISKNSNGCADTIQKMLEVFSLPTVAAGLDTVICLGDAAVLTASGASAYLWQPPSSLSCSTCAVTHASPLTTTKFVVTGTDNHGCTNKDSVIVTLQTQTTSSVAVGGEICQDSSFQLNASGATNYVWSPAASLNDANIPNPIATPTTTTEYMVIATEGSCQPDTNKVKVVVHPLPTVNAGSDETIIAGKAVTLNASGTLIDRYLWSPANTLSCADCSSPSAQPDATTAYSVIVFSSFGCSAKDEVIVNVLCDQSQLFIPNTFSPNGDGENDVFYPRGVGLNVVESFRIYNRWGELIFERRNIQLNDAAVAWDGTYKGKTLNPDVFVYVVEGLCNGGNHLVWKGDISLIR
jgi:gliding motility-associated-like protein